MKKIFQIAFTILLLISIPISNSYSQQLYKTFEVPGGGTGTSNTSTDSKDNTILYVVGGVMIVGIIVYALLKDKKEKLKVDTTAVILNKNFLQKNLSFTERVSNVQAQIPINISFGMQRDKAIKDERRYFVGLNYNF